jgi:hypothetical protein
MSNGRGCPTFAAAFAAKVGKQNVRTKMCEVIA